MIFVEGAPRSGTTLLVSMLASHPEIAGTVAESHLFDRGVGELFENHARQARFEGFLSNYVSEEELTGLARDLCDGVLGAMRSRVKPDARMVVEKTPLPRRDAEIIMRRKLAVYPDATYVHVVRERSGVVASLMRAPWADVEEDEAGEWWEHAVGAVRESAGTSETATYFELYYEELARDPVEVVAGLFERLELDAGEDVRGRLEVASRERISSFGPPAAGTGSASSPAAVGGGRGQGSGDRPAGKRSGFEGLRARAPDLAGRVERWRTRKTSIAQELLVAARRGDRGAVEGLTHPAFAFVLRSGAGDLAADGDEGRVALLEVAAELFRSQAVSESWTSISEGDTTALLLAAGYGDGRRTDVAAAALVRGGVVERLSVIAAGEPGGREPREWVPPTGPGPPAPEQP